MKIALAQMNPTTGDLEGNVDKILENIRIAKQNNADIVAFPEMAITGYCISDLIEDKGFVAANKDALNEIGRNTENIAAVIGFIDFDAEKKNEDGKLRKYNAAAVVQNGELKGVAHKTLLPNYRYFDDKRYFTAGKKRQPVQIEVNGRKLNLGVSICEDMWDENYRMKPIPELAQNGADAIININASPFLAGKISKRDKIIRTHIQNTKLPFMYVNTVGAADNGKNIIPFDGQSLAYDANGNLVAIGKQFEEDLVFADLDAKMKKIELPKTRKEKETYEALVMGLKEYGRKTGFRKAIEPLSGGIDSALGVALCVDAFGKDNVTAYNLPSKFNTDTTKNIAKKIAENLGIEYRVLPIQDIDNTVKQVFETNVHKIENKIAKENLHARIRGMLMMLESNDAGALLVSNGNKTEIALGYSTLYGDMCGGISVIGDLSKIDVYNVSRYVNEKFGREIIPEETFRIKPSAELSEGQYDPFDYYVVAPLVDEFIEKRKNPAELVKMFQERKLDENKFVPDQENRTVYEKHTDKTFGELAYRMNNLLKKSVYKRLQGPPIIAVTDRAFGFDFRETIINKWDAK